MILWGFYGDLWEFYGRFDGDLLLESCDATPLASPAKPGNFGVSNTNREKERDIHKYTYLYICICIYVYINIYYI